MSTTLALSFESLGIRILQWMPSTSRALRIGGSAVATLLLGGGLLMRWVLERVNGSMKALPPTSRQLQEEDPLANPLYRLLPALRGKLAWRELGKFPTPVHRFSCGLPGGGARRVEFWVKREDLSSPLYGGNKVRTLQYQLGACEAHVEQSAQASGDSAKFLVIGSAGSNQMVATKAHAASIQLSAESMEAHTPAPDAKEMDNTLNYLSALSLPGGQGKFGGGQYQVLKAILGSGWVFMPGGNNALGVLGQVGALLEVAEQIACGDCPDLDGIVVAIGSGCTVSGLILGVALARACGLPAFRRPGFRIHCQPVHPVMAKAQQLLGALKSQSWPLTVGRSLRQTAALLVSIGGPDVTEAALRIMHDELIINTLSDGIVGKYGAHSKASRQAKAAYDETAERPPSAPHLWLCGHFTAKSFALLLRLLENKAGSQKRLLFWQTKSAVQPLGPHDEWAAFEAQRQGSRALAKWAVVGGVGGTGSPSVIGQEVSEEHRVLNADEYRPLMTPVTFPSKI